MSSPARTRFDTFVVGSSSPELPSLSEMFRRSPRKVPPLRSGSNAAAIPAAARSTFTSAADILRDAPEIDIDTEEITKSPPRKTKAVRKPRTKPQAANGEEVANTARAPELVLSPKRFKNGSTKATSGNSNDSVQKVLPKGRVTKATAADKSKPKKTKAETVSRHFATHKQDESEVAKEPTTGRLLVEPLEPQLPALPRRIDWTPPRAASAPIILDSECDNSELLSSAEKAAVPKDVFQSLLDDFGHKNVGNAEVQATIERSEGIGEMLKKRKRLDLVSVVDHTEEKPTQSREASPTKKPAAKRKTRTITELATAPYAIPEVPDVDLLAPGNNESLLRYFDEDGGVKALVEHQSLKMDRKSSKPKKKPAKARKKKGATVEDPILLSPSSALKQSVVQDFVFGTSSQLVLEESPRALRDLQAAIQASMLENDPFASSPTAQAEKGKGLWHAGARDTDGSLLVAETLDQRDSAEVTSAASKVAIDDVPTHTDYPDISDICSSPPHAACGSNGPQLQTQEPNPPLTIESSDFEPPPSSQAPPARASSAKKRTAPTMARPKYELFTDAQLAKQIKSFGFKPLKRRQAMISLLEQCWVSQNQDDTAALANVSSSTALSTTEQLSESNVSATTRATVEPTKKARGRPRKADQTTAAAKDPTSPKKGPGRPRKVSVTNDNDTAATSARIKPTTPTKRKKATKEVEIADSENDDSLSLSPDESIFSSPTQLDLSMSEEGETSLNLTPTEHEANLFAHISKSVTSAPRSTNPNEPSWHEKMLMYDPVVLEDLAAWLNGGQLTRVGYDGEVSPAEVKKWCESKSVICLWKANTRGKERKRY